MDASAGTGQPLLHQHQVVARVMFLLFDLVCLAIFSAVIWVFVVTTDMVLI